MVKFRAARRALAQEHVDKGHRIVARQKQLIVELRSRGADSEKAEELLLVFERSLVIFENDLAIIIEIDSRQLSPR